MAKEQTSQIQITMDGTGFRPRPRRLPQTTVTNAITKKKLLFHYLERRFPMVTHAAREIALSLRNLPTAAPPENPGWQRVGIAVEYRIRLDMPGFEFERCNAYEGARRAAKWHDGTDSGEVCKLFRESFSSLLTDARVDSLSMARLSLAMAEFEVFVRRQVYDVPFGHQTLEQLLIQSDLAARDVATVAMLGLDTLRINMPRGFSEAIIVDGPIFGNKVIGADGDFIIDSCLIDVKVTVNPGKPSPWRDWLYQLIAYVLLDQDDTFGIRSVGVLLPRQAYFVRFDLNKFFPGEDDLEAMRIDLRRVLAETAREELRWPQDSIDEHLGR